MSNMVDVNKAVVLDQSGGVIGRVVDMSSTINLIPMTWGLINQLSVFRDEFGTQKNFMIPIYEEEEAGLLTDRGFEEGRNVQRQGERGGMFGKVPHFPVDDAIKPADLDGYLAPGTVLGAGMQMESVARLRATKLEGLRNKHALVKEYARTLALVTGDVYAPNGTIKTNYGNTINMYNEWGITRDTVNLNLAPTVDPLVSVSALYGSMQDVAKQGDALDGYVVVCSPELFETLIQHPYIRDVYTQANQYPQAREILLGRLGSGRLDKRYRIFEYGNMTFIEYRGVLGGQKAIPAGKGIAMPLGKALGFLQHAPAQRLDTINQVAQESYYFEYGDEKKGIIELMSETNFAAVLERPDLVKTVTFTIV